MAHELRALQKHVSLQLISGDVLLSDESDASRAAHIFVSQENESHENEWTCLRNNMCSKESIIDNNANISDCTST
jgi:hypothetical protein